MLQVSQVGRGEISVVLLHGMPSPPCDMVNIAEELGGPFRYLLVTTPGYHGAPAWDQFDEARFRNELAELLTMSQTPDAVVLGFGGGATRALALACNPHLRLRGVIALSGAARQTPKERDFSEALIRSLRQGANLRQLAAECLLAPASRANLPELDARAERWMLSVPADVLAAELESFVKQPPLLEQLAALRVPVFLRAGELDATTAPERSREIASLVPRAELEIVPGVGHALYLEDRAGTLTWLRRALSSLSS